MVLSEIRFLLFANSCIGSEPNRPPIRICHVRRSVQVLTASHSTVPIMKTCIEIDDPGSESSTWSRASVDIAHFRMVTGSISGFPEREYTCLFSDTRDSEIGCQAAPNSTWRFFCVKFPEVQEPFFSSPRSVPKIRRISQDFRRVREINFSRSTRVFARSRSKVKYQ